MGGAQGVIRFTRFAPLRLQPTGRLVGASAHFPKYTKIVNGWLFYAARRARELNGSRITTFGACLAFATRSWKGATPSRAGRDMRNDCSVGVVTGQLVGELGSWNKLAFKTNHRI